MNVVHNIQLRDTLIFKDVSFKIQPGLSVIYGLNRAGGPHSKNSNGVGKSALWSSLSEMIYEDPIVGEKQDRIKMGVRAFSFTSAVTKKKTTVVRAMKGRSEKVDIKVDGKSKEFRTPTIAKNYLKKAWPITQEEYNTYVHLDSRVPHPLVMGTTTQRKQFFTSFFGLDRLDAERKLFTAELNKLGKTKVAFQELRAQYTKSKEDLLSPEDLEKYRTKAKSYKAKLEVLQEEFRKIQETVRLVQFAQSAKEQIKTLNIACGGTISEEEFEKAVQDNTWELKRVRQDLEEAEEWEQYKRDTRHYTEAFDSLSANTRSLIKKYGLTALIKKAGAYVDLRMHASVDVMNAKNWIHTLKQRLLKPLPKKVKAPEEDVADLETLVRAYTHQLKHAERFEEGKCETCGQVVTIKNPKVLRAKLKAVEEKLKQHESAVAYAEATKARKEDNVQYAEWQISYEKCKAEETKYLRWEKISEELQNLPRKPRPFEGKKLQVVVLKRMLEEIQERRQLLEFCRPHLETIIEFTKLTKEDIEASKSSDELHSRMNNIQELLSKVQAKLEVHRTIAARQKETRERLIELKEQLKDEEPLRHLVNGYQDKNLKKMAVQAISTRLMQLINKYSKVVFPEDYTFNFEWGSQISLLVHRKYGKRVLTSDVRKLSGAESKLFTIILVLALLAFVPAYKRCSLLILDEPSANLSREMTEALDALIPVLLTLIPSVVLITPKDEQYTGAKPYTVVKKNGISRIVEGFPNSIK